MYANTPLSSPQQSLPVAGMNVLQPVHLVTGVESVSTWQYLVTSFMNRCFLTIGKCPVYGDLVLLAFSGLHDGTAHVKSASYAYPGFWP